MLMLATAAALAASAPGSGGAAPERQARAVVRVVKAARVEFGQGASGGDQAGAVRETEISDGDGSPQPAILVEFS